MSKLNNLDVELELSVFQSELGDSFPKIVNDVKAMIGRIPDKDIIAKHGNWKATTTGKLKSSEGYTVNLPLNNPAVYLLRFAMQLRAIGEAGKMDVTATIPAVCKDWIVGHRNAVAPVAA